MKDIIKNYFPELPSKTLDVLCSLYGLYDEWNSKINVISRKDFTYENFCVRHIIHSLAVQKFLKFKPESAILDVGTGGGFPGIPLAIVYPNINFTLLDSRNKKLIVVKDIATKLGLKNVKILWDRVENIKMRYDYITGRAVKDIRIFYGWTGKNLKPDGYVVYWAGGEPDQSFVKDLRYFKSYDIRDVINDNFFETKKIWVFR